METDRYYESHVVELEMILGAIEDVLNGRTVSDFEMSFSIIRRVHELRSCLYELYKTKTIDDPFLLIDIQMALGEYNEE